MEREDYYAAINAFKDSHENVMIHYGVPGQKWGVRRYQNPDGSYTAAGRERYMGYIRKQQGKIDRLQAKTKWSNGQSKYYANSRQMKRIRKRISKHQANIDQAKRNMKANEKYNKRYANDPAFRKRVRRNRAKGAAIALGSAAALAGLTAYGVYRAKGGKSISSMFKNRNTVTGVGSNGGSAKNGFNPEMLYKNKSKYYTPPKRKVVNGKWRNAPARGTALVVRR